MRMRSTSTATLATIVAVGAMMAGSAASQASPASQAGRASSDVAVTGFVAGGERNVESSHPVVFVFKETNRGPGAGPDSVDLSIVSSSGGTITDQLCILPNGNSINPDSPSCEPGALRVNQSSTMTVVVQPNPSSRVRIRVCTSNEGGLPDPNPSDDCKALSVVSF